MKKLFTLLLVLTGMVTTASADDYYLPGTWNSWSTTTNKFTNNTVTIALAANTTYEFKFYNSNGSWSGNTSDDATMKYNNCSGWWFNGSNNVGLKTTIAGNYTFTLSWVGDGGTTPCISVTYPTSYTRDGLSDGKYGTICLPCGITSVTGATLYKISSKVTEGGVLKGVYLEEEASPVAGNAYIFKASGTSFTATLSSTLDESANDANGMYGNLGADAINVPNDGTKYVIQGNVIKKVVEDGDNHVTCGVNRAYITLTDISEYSPTAPAYDFIPFEANNELSGINTVQASEAKVNGYFNLNGQRVAQPTKGLYIVNGKKVVLK